MMQLLSPDFKEGEYIPEKYTCQGGPPAGGVNPTLTIAGVPEGTRCLALIMDDPDAPNGTFVHWLVWNLPYNLAEIPMGALPVGAVEGQNGAGEAGYTGPCPPSGTHRYFFKLYALDATLDLEPGADNQKLEEAMRGHIIAQAELVGLYSKDAETRKQAKASQIEDRPGENP